MRPLGENRGPEQGPAVFIDDRQVTALHCPRLCTLESEVLLGIELPDGVWSRGPRWIRSGQLLARPTQARALEPALERPHTGQALLAVALLKLEAN